MALGYLFLKRKKTRISFLFIVLGSILNIIRVSTKIVFGFSSPSILSDIVLMAGHTLLFLGLLILCLVMLGK